MNTQQQNIFFAYLHNMRAIVLRKPRTGTVSPANMAQQVMLVVALFILGFSFIMIVSSQSAYQPGGRSNVLLLQFENAKYMRLS